MRLDIGCGRHKKEGFIGLDISKEDSDADIIASALKLPIKDSSISEINCSHLLEHLYPGEAQQLFDEFYRVLAPGGEAEIKVDRDWSKRRLSRKNPEHRHRYSEKEIKEMVRRFTFKKVKKRIYLFEHKPRNKIFVALKR